MKDLSEPILTISRLATADHNFWGKPLRQMKKKIDHYHFKGIKITDINSTTLQNIVDDILSESDKAYFCLTDVGNLMRAQEDFQLAVAINGATLSIADGTPLAWFGKLTGHRNVQRISGVDLFQRLIQLTNYSHFLLGDTPETQKKVIGKARKNNPNLRIDGYSPPFKAEFSTTDNQNILDQINKQKADIVWVSFGGGKQEKWMLKNHAGLKHGIMIGVGAAFKFYIGDLTIPPKIIQRMGLQWTSRLMKNPKRWMTKGQFKYRLFFSLSFPHELIKTGHLDRSSGVKI
jgi:N-acetylglucosaminyldiphosphoundecaprenol N-acetyl-beta-D-mannosaminyltransferase